MRFSDHLGFEKTPPFNPRTQYAKGAIHRREDGTDAPGGDPNIGRGCGEEARGQRTDALQTAQTIRRHIAIGGKAPAPALARAGERPPQENGCRTRPRSRTRDHEGDQRKKVVREAPRRRQVAIALERSLSGHRACCLLRIARSLWDYFSRLDVMDAPTLAAMRRLSAQYPRYGYRRIQVFLER